MTWKSKTAFFLGGTVLFFLLVMAFLPKRVGVETAFVLRGGFQETVDEDGKTRTRERYTVSAPLSGKLQRIQLKPGDAVEKGTLVAVITPSAPPLLDVRSEHELKERLGAAEAARLRSVSAVERAKIALGHAKTDFERKRQLAEKDLVSKNEFEESELAVRLNSKELEIANFDDQVARHEVETARAALLRYQKETGSGKSAGERWEIRSPVPGRVLRVLQESETSVVPGTPLLELADPSNLEVVVDVLTSDAIQIHPGSAVRIERWGGALPLQGRVRLVEPSAFTKVSALGIEEQRVNVVIDIVSPREEWKSLEDGYRVDVRIIVYNADDALKVPASALFREGDRWAVFVVSGGKTHHRLVEISRRNGLEAVVEKGLKPEEQVVVYPGDAVKDGIRVKVQKTGKI